MLFAVSAMENSALSVLQVHADADTGQYGKGLDPQKLEAMRISATRHGPLADILDACMRQLNEMPLIELDPISFALQTDGDKEDTKTAQSTEKTVLGSIVLRLKECLLSGIGLPTRGATARFINTLATMRPDCIKPHAMVLMRALQSTLADTSITLRREAATAAAAVAKNCKSGTLKKYVAVIVEHSKSADDATLRASAGFAMKELWRRAPDKMSGILAEVLPVILMVS